MKIAFEVSGVSVVRKPCTMDKIMFFVRGEPFSSILQMYVSAGTAERRLKDLNVKNWALIEESEI